MRRESDEWRAGADRRRDRVGAGREVDGRERLATLRGLKANRARLLAGVAEMSEYFRLRLLQLEFDRPAAVRVQGLAIGVDAAWRRNCSRRTAPECPAESPRAHGEMPD